MKKLNKFFARIRCFFHGHVYEGLGLVEGQWADASQWCKYCKKIL